MMPIMQMLLDPTRPGPLRCQEEILLNERKQHLKNGPDVEI